MVEIKNKWKVINKENKDSLKETSSSDEKDKLLESLKELQRYFNKNYHVK